MSDATAYVPIAAAILLMAGGIGCMVIGGATMWAGFYQLYCMLFFGRGKKLAIIVIQLVVSAGLILFGSYVLMVLT